MTTAATDVLDEFRRLGITVHADGENLRLRPSTALTPDLRARARAVKPELLALLAPAPLDHGLAVREVLTFPAALLPELPEPTTLVLDLLGGRRVTQATHAGCGRADRGAREWLALCVGNRRRTVADVLADLGATLRAVMIEGRAPCS